MPNTRAITMFEICFWLSVQISNTSHISITINQILNAIWNSTKCAHMISSVFCCSCFFLFFFLIQCSHLFGLLSCWIICWFRHFWIYVNHYICVHPCHHLSNFEVSNRKRKGWTQQPLNAQSVRIIYVRGTLKSTLNTQSNTQERNKVFFSLSLTSFVFEPSAIWRRKRVLKICGKDGRLTVAARDENERITTSQQKQLEKITHMLLNGSLREEIKTTRIFIEKVRFHLYYWDGQRSMSFLSNIFLNKRVCFDRNLSKHLYIHSFIAKKSKQTDSFVRLNDTFVSAHFMLPIFKLAL